MHPKAQLFFPFATTFFSANWTVPMNPPQNQLNTLSETPSMGIMPGYAHFHPLTILNDWLMLTQREKQCLARPRCYKYSCKDYVSDSFAFRSTLVRNLKCIQKQTPAPLLSITVLF